MRCYRLALIVVPVARERGPGFTAPYTPGGAEETWIPACAGMTSEYAGRAMAN
jgi:hypothetical protein